MSKLSSLSRHESLVLERRMLRAISRKPAIKPRPIGKPAEPTGTPTLAATATPVGKAKEAGLRTV